MNKSILLVFAVFGVVIVSGCVQQTAPTLGTGMAITDFSSSSEEVEGKNKNVRFSLEAKNQGGFSTPNAVACLIGSNFPGLTSEQMWENVSAVCQRATRTLSAASDVAGGSARFSWILRSPWIAYPTERTDEFTGRVYYAYRTQSSANVWVYSEAEQKAAEQRGEAIPTTLDIVKTRAPVDISMSTKQPVKSEDGYFTLRITVSNVGGGVVFNSTSFSWSFSNPPQLSTDIQNFVSLSFSYPSGITMDACESEVELKKGETRTISCDFTLSQTVTTKKSYTITVSANYGYYIDSTVPIKVIGRKNESP